MRCIYYTILFFIYLERNLNPKAACLKRREEEKNEEGPKLGMHTIPHPQLDSLTHQRLATSLPVSTATCCKLFSFMCQVFL